MDQTTKNNRKHKAKIIQLVDADAIGEPIGVTGRTILNWAAGHKIPTALRIGKVVRFDPVAVAAALGLK
jgi:hypothetical protein